MTKLYQVRWTSTGVSRCVCRDQWTLQTLWFKPQIKKRQKSKTGTDNSKEWSLNLLKKKETSILLCFGCWSQALEAGMSVCHQAFLIPLASGQYGCVGQFILVFSAGKSEKEKKCNLERRWQCDRLYWQLWASTPPWSPFFPIRAWVYLMSAPQSHG